MSNTQKLIVGDISGYNIDTNGTLSLCSGIW
jgi:hypothetical protein